MRRLTDSRAVTVYLAAVLAVLLITAGAENIAAKRPPKPTPTPAPSPTAPPSSGSITIAIAPTGTLEPSGEYATVD